MIHDVLLNAIGTVVLRAPLGSREKALHAENLQVIHRRTLILGLENGKLLEVVQDGLRKLVTKSKNSFLRGGITYSQAM
jgi:hypothetical protein